MRYWRRAALADGGATSDRGGDRRRRAEPNAGAGTPGVCPHRITRNTGRAQCARTPDPCNKVPLRCIEVIEEVINVCNIGERGADALDLPKRRLRFGFAVL